MFAESLALSYRANDNFRVAMCLAALAAEAVVAGQFAWAAQMLGAASPAVISTNSPVHHKIMTYYQSVEAISQDEFHSLVR